MQPWYVVSSRNLLGLGVVPAAVCGDERVSRFRPPAAALVGAHRLVGLQDWIDHRPGGLNRILTGKERSVADHGIAQKALIGRILSRLLVKQVKLSLVADELLP